MNRITRQRQDVEGGDYWPVDDADTRALVPLTSQPAPLVRINLPQPRPPEADDAPMLAHEIRRPTRAPKLESDYVVPLLQAFTTAVAAAIGAGALALAFHWPARAVLVAFGVALVGGWFWRLRLVDSLLWEIETFTGRDLDHDGSVGRPAGSTFAPVVVNAHEARQTAAQVQRANQAQSDLEELLTFVTRCANLGCSESKQGIGTAPAARADFARRRDTLITLGVAAWNDDANRRAGWRLTVSPAQAGVIIRRHILGRNST